MNSLEVHRFPYFHGISPFDITPAVVKSLAMPTSVSPGKVRSSSPSAAETVKLANRLDGAKKKSTLRRLKRLRKLVEQTGSERQQVGGPAPGGWASP